MEAAGRVAVDGGGDALRDVRHRETEQRGRIRRVDAVRDAREVQTLGDRVVDSDDLDDPHVVVVARPGRAVERDAHALGGGRRAVDRIPEVVGVADRQQRATVRRRVVRHGAGRALAQDHCVGIRGGQGRVCRGILRHEEAVLRLPRPEVVGHDDDLGGVRIDDFDRNACHCQPVIRPTVGRAGALHDRVLDVDEALAFGDAVDLRGHGDGLR